MENPFRPPILTPDKTDPTEDKKLVTKFLGEDIANLLDDNRAYTPEPQGITEEERKQALEEVEKLKAEVKPIPLEQKEHWNRKDLIQWTLEQVGITDEDDAEEWVDEYFTVNPDGTIVCEKDIDLRDKETITILPPQIKFNGNASFEGCTSLTTIPKETVFNGYADFRYCTSLTIIPEGIVFNGDVYFSECTSLASIPEGTVFNGRAYFPHCTSLTTIPEGTVFNGYADFRYCTSLTIIPEGIVFNGDVYFPHCTSLTTIPIGTVINGDASFEGCTSLTTIPKETVFNGNASFEDCTSLTTIPEGTVFNGNASFRGCTSLTPKTIAILKEKKDRGEIKGDLYSPDGTEYTGK